MDSGTWSINLSMYRALDAISKGFPEARVVIITCYRAYVDKALSSSSSGIRTKPWCFMLIGLNEREHCGILVEQLILVYFGLIRKCY